MNASAILALFTRSLREETRNKFPYISRALLGLMLLVFLAFVHRTSTFGLAAAPGKGYFTSIVYLNLFFFSMFGLSMFASAITEEKEELSLGLLRMTNLNPLSILLGKSTSRYLNACFYILAQIPFAMLAITLGGISMVQVGASFLLIITYLFLHANICLFASVVCQRTRIAAQLALVILLFLFLLIPWLFSLTQQAGVQLPLWISGTLEGIIKSNPFSEASRILSTGFAGPIVSLQTYFHVGGGLLFFLLSWLLFDRFSREQTEPAPSRGLVLPSKSDIKSENHRKEPFKFLRIFRLPRASDAHPIFRRDFHFFRGGWLGIVLRFIAIAIVIGIFIYEPAFGSSRQVAASEVGGIMIGISIFLLGLELAIIASRVLKQEVQWKTLSSLVTLPFSIRQIAYQKVAAALAGTLPTVFFLLLGFLLTSSEWRNISFDFEDAAIGAGFLFNALALGVAILHFIAYLSLYLKWGALPLGLFGGYLVTSIFSAILMLVLFAGISSGGMGGMSFVNILTGILWVVVAFVLHRAIGNKLLRVAASE